MVEQIGQAPFWHDGGMLYAHLPLPHPPGITPGASLDVHYAENIDRAGRLLDGLADLGRRRFGDRFVLVVFSDHPLRYRGACRSTLYSATPCDLREAFRDTRVPILVGADRPVDLTGVTRNSQVFSLLAEGRGGLPSR